MASVTLEKMQQDHLVMSVARALAVGNEAAHTQGIEPADCMVTISEETSASSRVWRIHYGPRDYISRRGGDLIVLVDQTNGDVQQVIRGQ
jgi:hypothetical protein